MKLAGRCAVITDQNVSTRYAAAVMESLEAAVLHTPGHSPGSICLTLQGDRPVVIAGDTLFARSVGRTDLWGSDTSQLVQSIRRKLFALPDETLVICGHGPNTTIGEERRLNPFVRGV